MDITMNCKVLNCKEIKIRKGDNAGKTFTQAHLYDGNDLHKISIPDEYKARLASNIGKDLTIKIALDLEHKKMYFKEIA